jgi:hypothetical protein
MIIARQEVEHNNMKNATHFAMGIVASPVEGEEPNPAIDQLLAAPKELLDLLKATSLAAATEALVRVKYHYPDVDMVKVGEGLDVTKDSKVVELEVREATMAIMAVIDYEGDDGEE